MREIRIYAGFSICDFMQDAIYYIRWLRFAPLNTDEESEAFDLIMTLLTMSVGYTDRKRVIGPAVCLLLEKQMRCNPEQMGKLETYLVNINSDSLRQIIEGHFSSQLDLLHEESLQLLDQVKQQQRPSLNDCVEEPLNIQSSIFLCSNGAPIGLTCKVSICRRIKLCRFLEIRG